MDFENFTEQSKRCFQEGNKLARSYSHQRLSTEHLLMQLLKESTGIIQKMILLVKGDINKIEDLTLKSLKSLPRVVGQDEIYIDQALQRTVVKANELASKNGDKFIAIDWLFVSLASQDHKAAQILRKCGVRRMRILTNNPRKIVGIEGYGLEVVGREPLEFEANLVNEKYLKTKRDKLGHFILGEE